MVPNNPTPSPSGRVPPNVIPHEEADRGNDQNFLSVHVGAGLVDAQVNPHLHVFGVEPSRSCGNWNDERLAVRGMRLPARRLPLSDGLDRAVARLVQAAIFLPRVPAHWSSCTNDPRDHRRVSTLI